MSEKFKNIAFNIVVGCSLVLFVTASIIVFLILVKGDWVKLGAHYQVKLFSTFLNGILVAGVGLFAKIGIETYMGLKGPK